jgi:3-oxoacyl-[acyl-carrier-protein] synthase-3
MGTYIKGIAYYLPSDILDNQAINISHPEWAVDKISNKTGIFKRHIASEDEFASDMALKAANNLFEEYNIEKDQIDFILYCTQSPDYFLPTTACILQHKLGLSTSCGALDFNLGCSGYVYGLAVAKGLIEGRIAKNVLLITSETYSKFINKNDKSNKTIFGDAASATLLSSSEGIYKLGDFVLGSDGAGFENLIVKNGGTKFKDNIGKDVFNDEGDYVKNDSNLFMNGAEIFSFTSTAVPKLIAKVLEDNNLEFDNVDYFLFHQANKYMLDFIRKKINIPQDKFIYYLENVGNTVSSTIPIALKEEGINKHRKGKIVLAGFGVGYSWGGCIIESV